MKNSLTLRIKKKWFDMILSGEKKEEYRKISPYYFSRVDGNLETLILINGYMPNSPRLTVECLRVSVGCGKKEWGGTFEHVYIFHLGKILKSENI